MRGICAIGIALHTINNRAFRIVVFIVFLWTHLNTHISSALVVATILSCDSQSAAVTHVGVRYNWDSNDLYTGLGTCR